MKKIDKSIYELESIRKSIESIDARYNKDQDHIVVLWVGEEWEPGQEPRTFHSTPEDGRVEGCVEIYNPVDGKAF
jgi:hypothetical protein